MFNRLTAQILAWKSNFVEEEKPSEPVWDRQISAHVQTRSRFLEVGGVTDDHYANLIPQLWLANL